MLFHCRASRHRAAAAGAVATAIMGRHTLKEAEEAILRRRPTQLKAASKDWKLLDWAHNTVHSIKAGTSSA